MGKNNLPNNLEFYESDDNKHIFKDGLTLTLIKVHVRKTKISCYLHNSTNIVSNMNFHCQKCNSSLQNVAMHCSLILYMFDLDLWL